MQYITITGNVGRDAELRQTGSGTICSFPVACSEKARGGDPETTTWYSVAVFGRRGEGIAPYIRKGTRITITGRLTLKPYVDSDGQARLYADVAADGIDFYNTERINAEQPQPQRAAQAEPVYEADEDIPF